MLEAVQRARVHQRLQQSRPRALMAANNTRIRAIVAHSLDGRHWELKLTEVAVFAIATMKCCHGNVQLLVYPKRVMCTMLHPKQLDKSNAGAKGPTFTPGVHPILRRFKPARKAYPPTPSLVRKHVIGAVPKRDSARASAARRADQDAHQPCIRVTASAAKPRRQVSLPLRARCTWETRLGSTAELL